MCVSNNGSEIPPVMGKLLDGKRRSGAKKTKRWHLSKKLKKLISFLFKVSLCPLTSSKVFFVPCDRKYSAKGSFTEHPQNIKWQKEKQRLLFWENWDLLNFPWGSINRRWHVRWPHTRLKKRLFSLAIPSLDSNPFCQENAMERCFRSL